jgi:dinuclear metal center YbgI/SA1388 family protein
MRETSVKDVMGAMERLAPGSTAEDRDNAGLQVGDRAWPARSVWCALDPLPDVVLAAVQAGVNMLVTHHPLLFTPLKSLDLATPAGKILSLAISHRLAIFCAHTNLDRAPGGVNDVLAEQLGLLDVTGLGAPGEKDGLRPIGLTGTLPAPMSLAAFALFAQNALDTPRARFAGAPDMEVRKAAVCGGSGRSLLKEFFRSGAEVFVTGDLGYHDARQAEERGLALLDLGHFATERLIVPALANALGRELLKEGCDAVVSPCGIERDPFTWT